MLTAGFFIRGKTWEQPRCPSWMNKEIVSNMDIIQPSEENGILSSHQRMEILPFATTEINKGHYDKGNEPGSGWQILCDLIPFVNGNEECSTCKLEWPVPGTV